MKTQAYKIVPAFTFDFLTPFYDPITELIGFGQSFKERVIRLLELRNGESLIDIGCGTGSLLIPAKLKYPKSRIVGIDPDQIVLDIASKKISKNNVEVELIKAYGEKIPFESSTFDASVSVLVFHHVPAEIKKQIIKEVYRILKPKGRFLLADFGKPHNLLWKILLKLAIFEEGKYIQDNLSGKIPIFLEEVGFKVKEISTRYRNIQFLLARKGVSH